MKSRETEEWIDVYFTRPVGLVFALIWKKLGVHPNVVTILSMFLGVAAGYCFYFVDLQHNIIGMLFMVFANLCDSTDGQLARLTNQKSFLGRLLDGLAGEVWFVAVYIAIALRMQNQYMPYTDVIWGIGIWALAVVAGILCHVEQTSLADYYRQIHLFFLNGKDGSELDNSLQQRAYYLSLDKKEWLKRLFYSNYVGYCRNQERRTTEFQSFFKFYLRYPDESVRKQFLEGSRPLMFYANVVSFNVRALILYFSCLINMPWLYFFFEMTILQIVAIYMHKQHENLSRQMKVELRQRQKMQMEGRT